MAVTLVVSMAGREPQTITLDQPRVVIGRGAHADVRLPSRAVSDKHAVLRIEGADVSIVDEGSTNGTRVNGAPLPRGRRKALRDGDVVAIAPFALRVGVVVARPDPPERTASLARRLLLDALSSSGGEAAPPRLVLLTGKQAGAAWVLPPPPSRVVVGRDAGCEVQLDDRDCSRQHAEVLRDAEGALARDLGSKNGVLVGGRPIPGERRLRHGDEITVGRTTLRYHDPTEELLRSLEGGADEPAPPSPAGQSPGLPAEQPEAAPAETTDVAEPEAAAAPAEEAPPAPAAPSPPAKPRGRFDWVVVVLAVVVLVVSVSALVLLLYGGR